MNNYSYQSLCILGQSPIQRQKIKRSLNSLYGVTESFRPEPSVNGMEGLYTLLSEKMMTSVPDILKNQIFSTASPEFSTDGTFAKCWTRLDNQIFLMKRGSEGGANAGLEPYSEMYASQLAAVFCPDSVPYDVVNYHEKKSL